MSDNERIAKVAQRFAEQFDKASRDNGDEFVKVRDEAPDEDVLQEMLFAAHGAGEIMPDDTVYAFTLSALNAIADHDGDEDEARDDFVYEGVDVYNARLVAWLATAPIYRGGFVNEALDEYGKPENLWSLLQAAQSQERALIFGAVWEAVSEAAEAEEAAEDDEAEDDA